MEGRRWLSILLGKVLETFLPGGAGLGVVGARLTALASLGEKCPGVLLLELL